MTTPLAKARGVVNSDVVDYATYINVDGREDKNFSLIDHLSSMGLNTNKVYRQAAITPKELYVPIDGDYEHGEYRAAVLLSFLHILEKAQHANYKRVMILEDDCRLYPDTDSTALENTTIALEWLEHHDPEWQLLCIGTLPSGDIYRVADNLLKIDKFVGSHAMIFNGKWMDYLVSEMRKNLRKFELGVDGPTPSDIFFSNILTKKYSLYPVGAIQSNSYINDLGPVANRYGGVSSEHWLSANSLNYIDIRDEF